jgi:hypothetical protein
VLTLSTLIASSNRLAEAATDLAVALEPLSSLSGLHLRDTQLRTSALRALASSPVAGRLHTLDLAFNQLDDSAADVVSHPPGFHALRTLILDNNDMSFASASSILASPAMPLLHTATFARNALKNVVDLHSLARRKIELLERSFAQASRDGAHLAERFYARLFERYPAVKPLFAHTSMRRQQQHLIAALAMVIEHLRAGVHTRRVVSAVDPTAGDIAERSRRPTIAEPPRGARKAYRQQGEQAGLRHCRNRNAIVTC